MVATISANDLRFAGESADSIRDEPAFLIINDQGKPEVVARSKLGTREPLFQLETDFRGDGLRSNVKVKLFLDGKVYDEDNIPHFNQVDAVFLTQSAVAKFLLPYYMRFKSAAQVQQLENSLFNHAEVIAAFHIPGSFTFPIWRVGIVTRKPSGEVAVDLFSDDSPPEGEGGRRSRREARQR